MSHTDYPLSRRRQALPFCLTSSSVGHAWFAGHTLLHARAQHQDLVGAVGKSSMSTLRSHTSFLLAYNSACYSYKNPGRKQECLA